MFPVACARPAAFALLTLLTILFSATVSAQDNWPQRPVRVIVPYAAGGSSDTLGRIASQGLTESFKQSFVIENRGGAGGIIGSQAVAKSAPDGYTLVVSGIGSHVIAPTETADAFDPMKDFTHIAILGGPPLVMVVNASLPITDLKSFNAYAKTQPGGISWGSPGKGTHGYLIGENYSHITKTPMVHVSYKGAAPAIADVVAGHIPASFNTLSTASTHIKSGRLRALAVTSSKRMPEFPDVPTFAELGYPKLTSLTWFSLSGPAGMSPALVTRINQEVRKVMHSPQAQEQLAKASMETFDWDAPKFEKYVGDEIRRWTPMIKGIHTGE
jgi:tripartite-type tricarboxylate transporter receptor subunit TctC